MVIGAAQTKLLLHPDEAKRHPTLERLRAPLRHGGFGLTSALKTSPAAFLGSMAAVAAAPVFAPYTQPDCPLPSSSLLHGWIDNSMRTVLSDVQTSQDETATCEGLLPPSAAAFFHHFAPRSPSTRTTPPRTSARAQLAGHRIHIQGLPAAREEDEEEEMEGGRWPT